MSAQACFADSRLPLTHCGCRSSRFLYLDCERPLNFSFNSMSSHRRNPTALNDPKLSVVIPVYNEKATIDEILRRVIDTPYRKEIILVDDCSTDGTRQIMEKL